MLLADHFNERTRRCDPSQELLAIEAECSVATIKRYLARLERDGFFKRRKRGGPRGGRRSDTYDLDFSRPGELRAKVDARRQQLTAVHFNCDGGQQLTAVHEVTAHSCANSNSSQLCTPNRKTQPEESNRKEESVGLDSSPTTVGASCADAREAEDSKTDRQKHILLAERILKLTAERAERFYQKGVEFHGRQILNEALSLMDFRQEGGEVFRNPQAILAMICRDLKNKPKPVEPPKPVIPIGAIDLGNGQYLSRW